MSVILVALAITCMPGGMGVGARAGEIRLQYSEIAALVHSLLRAGELKITCSGMPAAGKSCVEARKLQITLGNSPDETRNGVVLELDPPTFSIMGGRYEVRPVEPVVLTIDIQTLGNGLQLRAGVTDDVHFSAKCVSGACTDAALLPRLAWRSPQISLVISHEIAGEQSGSDGVGGADVENKPLRIGEIRVAGQFEFQCSQSWGLASVICAAARAVVGPDPGGWIRAQFDGLGDEVNARGLGSYASMGLDTVMGNPAGGDGMSRFQIHSIGGDDSGVRISFCILPDCA